jgi:teichuronic acid biosynthesis glycosyltransferase TuaC
MKVMIVCSGTAPDFSFMKHQAFIYDQVEAVKRLDKDIIFQTFFVKQKGIRGYLRSLPALNRKISQFYPDIVHAHGGTVALLSNLQRKVRVVVTFHGSDINTKTIRWISALVSLLSSKSIYVSNLLRQKAFCKKKSDEIIPCGLNLDTFNPLPREEALRKLHFPEDESYILFSSRFDNPIKNFSLAYKALKLIPEIKIREIVNRTREEVNLLINGASLVLLTSFSEGSPNIIKEAMACNCPIVTVDAGDVHDIIRDTEGCYITKYDPEDVAEKIRMALAFGKRTNGREKIRHLDNRIIAEKILKVYKSLKK